MHPRETITADFNGDGLPDIFVADHGYDVDPWPGHLPTLLLSQPGGGLLNANDHIPAVLGFSHSADAADIDGDGDIDIYVGNVHGGDIGPYLLINDGSAHFTTDTTRLTDEITARVHTKTTELFLDADGDGDADLFLGGDNSGGGHTMLINDGTGHFADAPSAMALPLFGKETTVTVDADAFDFDKDGRTDILAVETNGYVGNGLQIQRSNGDGSFVDQTTGFLDSQPRSPQDT